MSSLVTPARVKNTLLGLLIATSCPPSSRTSFGSAMLTAPRTPRPQDLTQVEANRLLQLGVRAGARLPVRAPADELSRVPEPRPFHVVVPDLKHPLRAQRDERQVLIGIPPAGHGHSRGTLACLVLSPVPRAPVELGRARGKPAYPPSGHGHPPGCHNA